MKINQLSLTPLLSRASQRILPSRSLNRLKSALLKSRLVTLLFAFFPSSQDPELHPFMVTAAKAAPSFHIPIQFLLVCKYKVQQGIFPLQFLNHLRQEITINALQKPLEPLVPCCAAPAADIGVTKAPTRTRACEPEACSRCLRKTIICKNISNTEEKKTFGNRFSLRCRSI